MIVLPEIVRTMAVYDLCEEIEMVCFSVGQLSHRYGYLKCLAHELNPITSMEETLDEDVAYWFDQQPESEEQIELVDCLANLLKKRRQRSALILALRGVVDGTLSVFECRDDSGFEEPMVVVEGQEEEVFVRVFPFEAEGRWFVAVPDGFVLQNGRIVEG